MIVDKTAHPIDLLRTAEHHLMTLALATERPDDEDVLVALNTVIGQTLRLVRTAADKLSVSEIDAPSGGNGNDDRRVPRG